MSNKDKEVEVDDRRAFEFNFDGEPTEFFLAMPSSEQIRKSEWHYSKVYNKALVEGVATTSEMMDILTKRGLYGPEYEARLQELNVDLVIKIAEMHNAIEAKDRAKAAREVQGLRDELYRWNQRITGPLSNSCEQMAEDAKTEYLTSVVVQEKDGKPVWKTYEDFVAESNQAFALKSRFEVLLWLQGLEPDFLEKTPENKVLRELALQKAESEAEQAQLAAASDETLREAEAVEKESQKAPRKPKAGKSKAREATAK